MRSRQLDENAPTRKNDFGSPAVWILLNLAFLMLALASPHLGLRAQANDPRTTDSSLPTVSFSLDFPGSQPDHFTFKIDANGHATYESTAKLSLDSQDEDAFHLDFTASARTRAKIFDLAARAKYFQGPLDSGKHNLASTGRKSLAYKDSKKDTHATYNYSPIPAVQELTNLFQNMSTTLEFGRRLDYDHRYQKLALDEELKRMEDMAKGNSLEEIQAVAPILRRIAADPSVINVVRARAQRLAEQAQSSPKR